MLLNCDLGEEAGTDSFSPEEAAMPFIDQANIACGVHAGSERVMADTVALAARHKVAIGAHPSYPDRENFGRTSMQLSAEALSNVLHEQIATLARVAGEQGMALSYVKPHGALYNDMMASATVRAHVFRSIADLTPRLPLMLLATAAAELHRQEAQNAGIDLLFEAFADRAYTDEGTLVPRTENGAVHNADAALHQVKQLCRDRSVTTSGGKVLSLHADTLCVHGDNPEGVAMIRQFRALLDAH